MSYYHGTTPYPHPTEPGKVLCRIRNRMGSGWRVSMNAADAEKIRPYDLFEDRAGTILCQTVTGRKFPLKTLVADFTTFRHVEEWVDKNPPGGAG